MSEIVYKQLLADAKEQLNAAPSYLRDDLAFAARKALQRAYIASPAQYTTDIDALGGIGVIEKRLVVGLRDRGENCL